MAGCGKMSVLGKISKIESHQNVEIELEFEIPNAYQEFRFKPIPFEFDNGVSGKVRLSQYSSDEKNFQSTLILKWSFNEMDPESISQKMALISVQTPVYSWPETKPRQDSKFTYDFQKIRFSQFANFIAGRVFLRATAQIRFDAKVYIVSKNKKLVPKSSIASKVDRLGKIGKFSDVSVICEDKTFDCHKVILMTRSDSFAEMFVTDPETRKVEIKDFSPDFVKKMINFIYYDHWEERDENLEEKIENDEKAADEVETKVETVEDDHDDEDADYEKVDTDGNEENSEQTDQIPEYEIPDDELEEMLKIADCYKIQSLKNVCEYKMLRNLNIDNSVNCLHLAKKFEVKELFDRSFQTVQANLSSLVKNKEFVTLMSEFPDIFQNH